MLLIGSGVVAVLLFIHFSLRAEAGDATGLRYAQVEALILTLLSAFAPFVALFLFAIQCDESCDPSSNEWWHKTDAWQWSAQLAVAVIGFSALVGALVLTQRREHRSAMVALVVSALCFANWAVFLAPMGDAFGI